MLKVASKTISVIFHPLLMPTYAFALIIWCNPFLFAAMPLNSKFIIIGVTFLNTFVFPLALVFLFVKLRFISNMEMRARKDRIYPFILTLIIFGSVWYRFYNLPYPAILSLVLLTATIGLTLAFVINLKWKISIHCIGIAGLAGIIFHNASFSSYNLFMPLMFILIACGVIGTARMILKEHNPAQIYLGYLVGLISAVISIYSYN